MTYRTDENSNLIEVPDKEVVYDHAYHQVMQNVLDYGDTKGDRTGTGTLSLFDQTMTFNLTGGYIPLITTKKMHIPSIIHEIIWYLSGDTNIKYLNDNGVRIWNEWADKDGELGPVYGAQWRKCPVVGHDAVKYETDPPHCEPKETIDQIAQVIDQIKNDPNSRRIIVNAWNVGQLDDMKLPPCHAFFQFYANPETRELSLKLTQRSADVFLGVPFNIAQYSILLHMIAHVTGYTAKEFIWSGGDVHIYKDHIEQCKLQLTRLPYFAPKVKLRESIKDIDDFIYEDIEIVGYQHHEQIKAKVSV